MMDYQEPDQAMVWPGQPRHAGTGQAVNEAWTLDELIACPSCDLLHGRRALQVGEHARCQRCTAIVQTRKIHTLDRSLAGVVAAILLLLVSLLLPFLSLSQAGISSHISVFDAVGALWQSNMHWLGAFTFAFIILLPLARFLLLAWVLGRLRFGCGVLGSMRTAFRWATRLEPWAMADIFMVGVVVSLVKVSALANLHTGLAFWSLLLLVGISVYINFSLCKDTVWTALTQQR